MGGSLSGKVDKCLISGPDSLVPVRGDVRRPCEPGTSFTKVMVAGRLHPLLCTMAFLLELGLLFLCRACPLPAQSGLNPSGSVPPISDESFWQTEAQSDWQAVPDDPVREKILAEARFQAKSWTPLPAFQPEQRDTNRVRLLNGNHIHLYTDMPSCPAVDELPTVFDLALNELCTCFQIDANEFETWQADVFFIRDVHLFESWGALSGLPGEVPGYSNGNRIWVFDQQFDYYNRLLLIHELVHSMMNRTFGALSPRWYSEGIAEYLAFHQWDGRQLKLGQQPTAAWDFPGFDRLRIIRKMVQRQEYPELAEILDLVSGNFKESRAYSLAWSFVFFLSRHDRYRELAAQLPYYMMSPDPNSSFWYLVGQKGLPLTADWSDFVRYFGLDYDFARTQIDYAPGRSLQEGEEETLSVSASAGWQNSGLVVEAGVNYAIGVRGEFTLYDPRKEIPCDAGGVTMTWYAGRPRGSFLFCPGDATADDYWHDTEPLRTSRKWTAPVTGPLFFRINDDPANLSRNDGRLTVRIRRLP